MVLSVYLLVNSTKEFVGVENRDEVVDFVESGGG